MPEYRDSEDRGSRRRDRRYSSASPSPPRRRRSRSREDRTRSPDRKRHRSRSRERKHSYSAEKPRRRSRDEQHKTRYREDPEYNSRPSKKRRSHSRSRSPARRKTENQIEPFKRSERPLPSQKDAFVNEDSALADQPPPIDKEKPNFGTTGRLAAASNTVKASGGQSIILKYHEPPEARKPASKDAWRMYVFKGPDIVDTVELAEQSCWLFGRETAVVDFLVEHPSCSKQHAVIQFRYIEKGNEYGDKKGRVRPYVIDLESANGTKVNEETIPAGRYVELRDKDVVHFGHSTREYVLQLPPPG